MQAQQIQMAQHIPHHPGPVPYVNAPHPNMVQPGSVNVAVAPPRAADDGAETQRQRHELVALIKSQTFIDIIIRNALENHEDLPGSLDAALDKMTNLHANLFNFGIFMSGFQFVGVLVENEPVEPFEFVGMFILCIGFFLSMFSALISFIAMEYFNGIKNEEPEFIVLGIMKYKRFFWFSELVLFGDTVAFLLSMNILIHSYLNPMEAWVLNGFCLIGFSMLGIAFVTIVMARQSYTNPITGKVCQRHLYKLA